MTRRDSRFLQGLCGLLIILPTTFVAAAANSAAQNPPEASGVDDAAKEKGRSGVSKSSTKQDLSAEDRSAALSFVAEHHPELSHLLMQLQKSRPLEFERAVRELVLQTQAIQRLLDKNPARYQTQLAAWKLDSQIRVLMARWARTEDAALETQIRTLIAQRQKMKVGQLQADRQKLEEQLKRIDDQLAGYADPEEQRVDTEWEQLSRRAKAAGRSVNPGNRAAVIKGNQPAKSVNEKSVPVDGSSDSKQ
jgi:hypothetical protein